MTTQQREVTRKKREEGTTEIMTKAKIKDKMKGNEEVRRKITAVIHQKSSCSRPQQFDNKALVLQSTAHQ